MTLSHQPLVQLASALEISTETLVARDRPSSLLVESEVRSQALASLTEETLQAFVLEYRSAATFRVLNLDLVELSVEGDSFDVSEFARLHEQWLSEDRTYTVNIKIEKTILIQDLGLVTDTNLATLLFFRTAVERELKLGPSSIEEHLWHDPTKRLLLLILDEDLRSNRSAISVLGGNLLASPEEAHHEPIALNLPRAASRRDDYISWDSGLQTTLTPAHFARSADSPDTASEIDFILDGLTVALSAMYVCDRARQPDQMSRPGHLGARADFRGRDYVAVLPIDWSHPPLETTDVASIAALELFEWCYQAVPERPGMDMLADRLPFVQSRVVQLLEGVPENERMEAFAAAAPSLIDSCRWNWLSFIEGRVGVYLEQVKGLEEAVGSAVSELADRTTALTAKITETALAEVAALVGAFIAAAFQRPFQSRLFVVAMVAYAVYVALFPLGLGLPSAIGTAEQAVSSFEPHKRNVAQVLGSSRANDLVGGRVTEARDRFRFWSQIAALSYLLAAVAAVLAAVFVPGIVKHH